MLFWIRTAVPGNGRCKSPYAFEKLPPTGIRLAPGTEYPLIAWVCPSSPAANSGKIRPGKAITAVSPNGTMTNLQVRKGMSVQAVQQMLDGDPGTKVLLELTASEGKEVVLLDRMSTVTVQLADGSRREVFLGTNFVPTLMLTDDEIANLRHVPSASWTSITNGMTTQSVVRLIGKPLRVEPLGPVGECNWEYGWLIHLGAETFKPGAAVLGLSNGVVKQAFRVKEPPGYGYKVEILSKWGDGE